MKYLIFIFLFVAVCGQKKDPSDITAVNVDIVDNKIAADELDQNAESDNINPDYFGERIGEKYREGGYRNTELGNNIEEVKELLFGDRRNPGDLYRGREHYRFDEGNPDVHGRIERPCQAYDTFCIRKYISEHSRCKISAREVPEPLIRAQTTINMISVNMSAVIINSEYRGIKDGRVAEFYIDKITDQLVIALDFDSISVTSKNSYLKYYHRGREPTVIRDITSGIYEKVTVTVVIPNLKDLKLERAEISSYANVPVPQFLAGPQGALSTDPEVLLTFASIFTNVPILGLESLLTDGVYAATNFIQYNICDFGLKGLV